MLSNRTFASKQNSLPSPAGGRGAGGEGARKNTDALSPMPAARLPARLLGFARQLRHGQTDAEVLIWKLLRNRQLLNAKFRRQRIVVTKKNRYILDFYCIEHRLAIELDGGQHDALQDALRDSDLARLGIRTLRFWNNEVLQQTEAVMEAIFLALQTTELLRAPSPLAPLPQAGEGNFGANRFAIISPVMA